MHKILVSGCLNGRPIRFNSTNVSVASEIWDRWESEGRLVAFCPELAAGFPLGGLGRCSAGFGIWRSSSMSKMSSAPRQEDSSMTTTAVRS